MKALIHFLAPGFAFVCGALLISHAVAGGNPQREAIQARADAYLIKSDSIRGYFSIDEEGIATYASPDDQAAGQPEFLLRWDEVSAFRRMVYAVSAERALELYLAKGDSVSWDAAFASDFPKEQAVVPAGRTPEKPLLGMKIALDPGHLGGTMDFAWKTERKFVRMKPDPAAGLPGEIGFNEGNLALATAMVLKEKLEKAGAEVLLSREKEGKSAMGVDLDEWLEGERIKYESFTGEEGRNRDSEDFYLQCAAANYIREEHLSGSDSIWWMKNASRRNIYRVPFLKQDFLMRAHRINAFRPHLTLIIHYNIHETNEADKNGYLKPTERNYGMAFIPGSFMEGELSTPEERLAFLTKLLTDDLRHSESLSARIMEAHERQLGVPTMEWDESLKYLSVASLRTPSKGVFARNLSLTRLINGPMCFGESLLQDNIEECKRLNRRDFIAPGMTTPSPDRVREVAQAYFEGVLKWADQW